MTQSQNEQYLFETLLDHGAPGAQPSLRAAELSEAEVAEVASELLSAASEAEIDHLLPKLLPARKLRAAGLSRLAARPAPRSAARRTARLIKRVTAAVLSNLRRAGLSIPDPDLAGDPFPGDVFGGELSEPRELELEVAKKLVRFGNGAMCRSLLAARHQPPAIAARTAVVSAAKAHAPGLLGRAGGCPICAGAAASQKATRGAHAQHAGGHAGGAARTGPRTSGRWVRRPTGILLTA